MTRTRWTSVAPTAVLLVSILVPACSFERRVEPEDEEGRSEQAPAPSIAVGGEARAEELVLETVRLFRESVAVGDLSLALVLLHREATLVDELAGGAPGELTPGELLLEIRRQHAGGIDLEPTSERVAFLSSDAALVVSDFVILEGEADQEREPVGRMHETVFLVPADGGWRIRDLHRSVTPQS